MADSIIREVGEELKELGKDIAKETVKQPIESGKAFFLALIGMENVKAPTEKELAEKEKMQEAVDQKKLAEIRKRLRQHLKPRPERQRQPSAYEQKMKEEVWKKQRQVELAKQKQKMQLPNITTKTQRGSAFAFKQRKKKHVEVGKLPGQ